LYVVPEARERLSSSRPHAWLPGNWGGVVKPESLRTEFILTGGATLVGFYLLVASIERRSRASCFSRGQIMRTCAVRLFAVPPQLQNSSTAVVAIAILIGLSFVVGIIVVQVTFFFPTEGLIYVRRQVRIRELRGLDAELRKQYEPRCGSHYAILAKLFRQIEEPARVNGPYREFAAFYFQRLARRTAAGSGEESLVLSIGRQLAPEAVIREYEYRRSNRQVFVGVLPAFVMAVVAAAVNPWSSRGGVQDACELAAILVGLAVIYALCASANYQERVAQAQLLDTAFTGLWSQHEAGPVIQDGTIDGQAGTAAGSAPEQLRPAGEEEGQSCTSKK
jgi:hypothetical protein